ncbi:MAG: Unknown protein [uncultured Sulfurovum sp.]|uniref:Helicase HerA central domain-containing protein n=1 Tax=uncultured Sulfurovum sp. TaxID=269237 RepID=A0A6S6UBP2_9BACT|nr:MAG: Unknown protein [uncultured Sulfurovum sp.]
MTKKIEKCNNISYTDIKLDIAIQNFLERRDYERYDIQKIDIENNEKINFVKISHISYDREKSNNDLNLIDFQQLLSSVASKSQKFVYMIEGSKQGISLYLGSRDSSFLKETFEGIYSGSTVEESSQSMFSKEMRYSRAMLGIPALKRDSDKEYKQSLEKILFPMQGKIFRMVLVAESYNLETVQNIISNYQTLGSELHRLVKQSKNEQQSNANTEGVTFTEGSSFSDTESTSDSDTKSSSHSGGLSMIFASYNYNEVNSNTQTTNFSRTNSKNQSQSLNQNQTKTDTIGITYDEINKSAEYCENLIDTYIKRFQKGLNHGMWNSSLYIQAEDEGVLSELEHTLKSVYSGDESYYESIRFSNGLGDNQSIDISKLPMLYFDKKVKHPIHHSFLGFSSAINTEELSILASLPHNDVDGISVSKVSSFGLTQAKTEADSIDIGVVLNKKKPTHQRFRLSQEALNGHLFVSGITGSGKSNTIKSILGKIWNEYHTPFLVIEPAKSEYQFLQKNIPELQIFKLGGANDVFRFNPFVFDYKKENQYSVLNHIDSIKSSFNAAFPMYGPMPYILEEAIHKIYEDKGWNLSTLEHPAFDEEIGLSDEFNRMLFPKMDELQKAISSIVDGAGYHNELQSNIKAALITRIKNLTIGAKGMIFNSQHAIESKHLFEKPTIIELSSIVNSEEKSLIMGLILNSLYRYRESFGIVSKLKHVVVIEEAHRLLPNIPFEQNMESTNSKASAVESFTNMLAEARAFGQGIIIADQVANKLHSDVIKNTNIKILHRTMAKDDRSMVGDSINLNEHQVLDIAELARGEAIVHSSDVHKAFLVKIDEIESSNVVDVSKFQKDFLEKYEYYAYLFPFENKFYSPLGRKLINSNRDYISNPKNQYKVLQIITQALLGESKKCIDFWHSLEEKNIYLIMEIFSQFEALNSISTYKKPYYFKKMYQAVVELFLVLDKGVELENEIQKLQKSLLHKKVENLYASMEFYSEDKVDFSLLIEEHLFLNKAVVEEMNQALPLASRNQKELSLLLHRITNKLFGITSKTLTYVILAMRHGNVEKDLNPLVSELSNVQ